MCGEEFSGEPGDFGATGAPVCRLCVAEMKRLTTQVRAGSKKKRKRARRR